MSGRLILVLGDQLDTDRGALADARPGIDTVLMAEVVKEATYVPHNRHKIAFIFAAMRHFRDELRGAGFRVIYYTLDQALRNFGQALESALGDGDFAAIRCSEPGEYRVLQALQDWSETAPLAIEWIEDDRYLCSIEAFARWADGRKQLRMEYFYRHMRRQHKVLMEGDGPAGGRWNYDRENRRGWRGKVPIPERPVRAKDPVLDEVIALVESHFPDNPGDLTQFEWAVTRQEAETRLASFINDYLPMFGTYQDALAEESPWLFHSLLSPYLNVGLLDPLAVCRAVEAAWREGRCELAAAEGFIRQVLGWREYVRGIYWLAMPAYAENNALATDAPLPHWFWSASIDLRCLQGALRQSLDLGYAHHIQRLMVIGNFAMLAGIEVKAVCEWYLAVYVDAFEWVELPNTLGMALFGDGGIMASKPYAASGKYLQRQGDHCRDCRYDPGRTTGEGACPYNSLYWNFLNRHEDLLRANPRMALALGNWRRKPAAEREAILAWAQREQRRLVDARA